MHPAQERPQGCAQAHAFVRCTRNAHCNYSTLSMLQRALCPMTTGPLTQWNTCVYTHFQEPVSGFWTSPVSQESDSDGGLDFCS